MEVKIGEHYIDNDENVYKCIALTSQHGYSEAVMEVRGMGPTIFYCVFYRSHYAWLDRECPDFRLIDEVDYLPDLVPEMSQ